MDISSPSLDRSQREGARLCEERGVGFSRRLLTDALEGMLAAQLVATHMAAIDCYERLNTTNDRAIHGYNLNQAK